MRKLTQLFDYAYKNVNIKWHRPVKLEDNWKYYSDINQDDIFLYKIVAKRGEKYKLIYIGMSERQTIQSRLYNKDHQIKQQFYKEENNGWVLYCSVGEFFSLDNEASNKWAKHHVKQIEKLLIITHADFPSIQNIQGTRWFYPNKAWINIKNSGFIKDGMFKIISYGLFSS